MNNLFKREKQHQPPELALWKGSRKISQNRFVDADLGELNTYDFFNGCPTAYCAGTPPQFHRGPPNAAMPL